MGDFSGELGQGEGFVAGEFVGGAGEWIVVCEDESGGMVFLLRQGMLDKVSVVIDGGGDYEAVEFWWCSWWRVGRASGRMLLLLWT